MLTKLLKAAAVRRSAPRPPRGEVEPVALELIGRYGAEIMATARRYAETREDAEDAYQRGLEILLTKAPSTSEDHLLPWLKTVVKHEAYSLRRQRERAAPPGAGDAAEAPAPDVEAHVEQLERLQMGAEALARLKPHETRCLILLAEGHSYGEICALTGFSYTKVNRCLTEGRRSFLRRVEGIESGAECERLAPLLSALADGEATAKDMALLRPHLRGCLACRAALRDAREVPSRVAALAPVGLLAAVSGGHDPVGGAFATLRAGAGWLHDRATLLMMRVQDVGELAASHKLAAAAASAAALGGGGIATVSGAYPERDQQRERHALVAPPRWRPAAAAVAVPPRAAASRPVPAAAPAPQHHGRRAKPEPKPAPAAPPSTTSSPPPSPPIEPAARVAPAPPPTQRREPQPPAGSTGEFGP